MRMAYEVGAVVFFFAATLLLLTGHTDEAVHFGILACYCRLSQLAERP